MRTSNLLVAVLLVGSSAIHAQKPPKRPQLPAGADTNSASVYYAFAMDQLGKDPQRAADALYWSTQLDPNSADAFYARRVALLLADPRRLIRYWNGERSTVQSKEIQRIDSLYYQALTLNPFVSQTIDVRLLDGIIEEISNQYEREYRGEVSASEVRFYLERSLNSASPSMRGWVAYGRGDYPRALELYASAIKQDKRNGPLHLDRARIFFQTARVDSALAELTAGLEDLRTRDKKELIYVYQSKALTEHSIGIAHKRLDHDSAAREAFGRALQEDLSYAPAHIELAYLALAANDTAAALVELDLAVQVRGNDPHVRFMYSFVLDAAGKAAEAEEQARKTIELAPLFALPHLILGASLEKQGKKSEAAAAYTNFLKLAARDDLRRKEAAARLEALNAP